MTSAVEAVLMVVFVVVVVVVTHLDIESMLHISFNWNVFQNFEKS